MAAPKSSKIRTAVVIDFETGGLDSSKHGITEVGMMTIRLDTFKIIDTYSSYVIPYKRIASSYGEKKGLRRKKSTDDEEPLMEYNWEMSAKKIGITEDMCIEEGKELKEVVSDMVEFFKRAHLSTERDTLPILIGQNIVFDIGFLAQIFSFTKTNMKGLMSGTEGFLGFIPDSMDTESLAKLMYANNPHITSYALGYISESLGIELFDAHNALGDVEATASIITSLSSKMRNDVVMVEEREKAREHFNF